MYSLRTLRLCGNLKLHMSTSCKDMVGNDKQALWHVAHQRYGGGSKVHMIYIL